MKEVANWLNFSLVGIVLAYRAFYSAETGNWNFFLLGLFGILIFFVVSQAFYYSKVFGGGDAKLLVGIGGILPYQNYIDIIIGGGLFILLLLFVGAIYSLIVSVLIAYQNYNVFKKGFKKKFNKFNWRIYLIALLFAFGIIAYWYDLVSAIVIVLVVIVFMFLYIYLKVIDEYCMKRYVKVKNLREGDWIAEEIRINGKTIGDSVHGLSREEIRKLIKRGNKVLIKNGIAFVPAFLISYVIMLFFYASLEYKIRLLLTSLS